MGVEKQQQQTRILSLSVSMCVRVCLSLTRRLSGSVRKAGTRSLWHYKGIALQATAKVISGTPGVG
jgi:hypothetical protein